MTKLIYESMVKKGKTPKEILNCKDMNGKSMLLRRETKEEVLRWLVKQKELELDAVDRDGNNAFHVHPPENTEGQVIMESKYLKDVTKKQMLSHKNKEGMIPTIVRRQQINFMRPSLNADGARHGQRGMKEEKEEKEWGGFTTTELSASHSHDETDNRTRNSDLRAVE